MSHPLHDLLSTLPQRFPFRFVDRVIAHEPGARLLAGFSPAHTPEPFRGTADLPEVCVMEGLAQATVLLALLEFGPLAPDEIPVLGSLSVRVNAPVAWEDTMEYEVVLIRMAAGRGVFAVRASAGTRAIAEGELTVARTVMGGEPVCAPLTWSPT